MLHIEGDDLMPQLDGAASRRPRAQASRHRPAAAELGATPLSANAYLGAWGIVEALNHGADVVVCPRVTDASVVVGPAAWHFGWKRNDWDRLAGAVVAGHVVECGTQCTGGNYAFFQEVPGLEHPGFPIAEMHADGSCVITKHEGTGGLVSVGTVTAQLLYEIDKPAYANPDVVARFDTIRLEQEGPDRVRISGVRGEPAPPTVKVCLNYLGGYRNQMTFVLTGLDIEEKAALVERTLRGGARSAATDFDSLEFDLMRTDKPDAPTNTEASGPVERDGQEPATRSTWAGPFPARSSRWPWPAIRASSARLRRPTPAPSASTGRRWCRPTSPSTPSCSKTARASRFAPSQVRARA